MTLPPVLMLSADLPSGSSGHSTQPPWKMPLSANLPVFIYVYVNITDIYSIICITFQPNLTMQHHVLCLPYACSNCMFVHVCKQYVNKINFICSKMLN